MMSSAAASISESTAGAGRPVAREVDVFFEFVLSRLLEHVAGYVYQHRAGPTRSGNVKRLPDGRGDICRAHDQIVVLGDGQRRSGYVRFLECVGTDGRAPNLPGDRHHRHGVHHRGGKAGNEVRRSRAGSCKRDAHLATGACVSVGRVGRPLFVPHQDMAQRRVLRKGTVQGQYRSAGRPNTTSTPSRMRLSQTIWPPVLMDIPFSALSICSIGVRMACARTTASGPRNGDPQRA